MRSKGAKCEKSWENLGPSNEITENESRNTRVAAKDVRGETR